MASPEFLATLATVCPSCGHTEAWHMVDGRCAYLLKGGGHRLGGQVIPNEYCGCER